MHAMDSSVNCPAAISMRIVVLAAITAYQRYVSPYKGFCCAYRAHTGRQSCSSLGFRAVRRYGVFAGLAVLRRRTYLCGVAHSRHAPTRNHAFQTQHGFCDVGCDLPCDLNCDLPSFRSCGSIADFVSYCDCGSCDWTDRKGKGKDEEQYVHIPPSIGRSAGK